MKRVNCILLVDDNPADNYFHTYIIKEANICDHLNTVYNGEEALTYLKKSGDPDLKESFPKPDLLFLDINMPKMNGFEFLEEFIKLDDHLRSKVIVIMLTTSLNPDDREKAEEINEVKEFISKPLDFDVLDELTNKYF